MQRVAIKEYVQHERSTDGTNLNTEQPSPHCDENMLNMLNGEMILMCSFLKCARIIVKLQEKLHMLG